jgi:hypothetical protein
MASPTEESFRRIERTLDHLIEVATPKLNELGVAATDESARNYHYKNQFLSWSYRFENRWSFRCSEIALVTSLVTFHEPGDADVTQEVEIWSRSEIFQVGQLSRWEHTEQHSIPIAELTRLGIAEIVCTVIANGRAEIDSK